MLLLDVTVVNVALPAIRERPRRQLRRAAVGDRRLRADAGGDAARGRGGRRPQRPAPASSSAACSSSPPAPRSAARRRPRVVLDLARGAQGVGAAAMFAASLALLAAEFQGRERGFALGVWGAITGGALAIGPLVGGLLVDGLSWRWIFLVNLPIGLLLIWLSPRSCRSRATRRRAGSTSPAWSTFGAACFLATFALIRGNAEGWGSPPIVGSLAAAALLGDRLPRDRAPRARRRCCRSRSSASPPSPAPRSSPSRSRSRSTRCCSSWRSTSRKRSASRPPRPGCASCR